MLWVNVWDCIGHFNFVTHNSGVTLKISSTSESGICEGR